jgi:sugar O-acyltransferase (sialic acid O-acetyltransferase NeuD family)
VKSRKLVIFGIGEIGLLAKYYFDRDSDYEVVGFTADDQFVSAATLEGLPLIPFGLVKERFPPDKFEMHVALSYRKLNQIREEKYREAKAGGYTLASYVCSKSVYWDDLSIGDNCFILENQTIQPTVQIGSNVVIWSGNHLGHGSVIGDHTYISSHVCISGHTEIGTHCFLGVNSTTRDFVKVGNSVFVTMGATVTRDIEDGSVVVGAKGYILLRDSESATRLKSKYFDL